MFDKCGGSYCTEEIDVSSLSPHVKSALFLSSTLSYTQRVRLAGQVGSCCMSECRCSSNKSVCKRKFNDCSICEGDILVSRTSLGKLTHVRYYNWPTLGNTMKLKATNQNLCYLLNDPILNLVSVLSQ